MEYLFWAMVVFMAGSIFNDLFVDPKTRLGSTRKKRAFHRRKWNAARGVTMRPGWWYNDVDGKRRMSPTGKEKDMIVKNRKGVVYRNTPKFGGNKC